MRHLRYEDANVGGMRLQPVERPRFTGLLRGHYKTQAKSSMCGTSSRLPKAERPSGLRSSVRESTTHSWPSAVGLTMAITRLLIAFVFGCFLLTPSGASAQTAPPAPASPRPITPVLQFDGGSCGTQFAPCPSIAQLGMFFWFSGQYLGPGLGGDPHTSAFGGSIDLAMEVAKRVAVSISVPGALNRTQTQSGDQVAGIGGPLETRVRVRIGPESPAFYSVQARPLWSSVVEARAQILIRDFDGDARYVGRVQRGYLQPSFYGAGELNLWRFQLAPGAGISLGDHEAHLDLSLRVSMLLLDRLYGDVEVLRRQALAVPSELGRCQSAWVGAAGARFQFRRGVFMSARYVGGQGDCVPSGSFQLNLAAAFGDGFMRIPTPDEVGWIPKWHALLMGMIDPLLDCQGIMRADDGTPMFRFGFPDGHDPSLIRRNNVAYRVGEHFWQKDHYLYHEADLSHPVLDLNGESPLTFAERAAMHDCPTLPGLGSPCQVALNLPKLRHSVEQAGSPMQLVLNEDAQILACLNHLSPVKAAAVFATLEQALGPLLQKLPQVTRWGHPTASGAQTASAIAGAPTAVAGAGPQALPSPAGNSSKVAAPKHPRPSGSGPRQRPLRRHGTRQPADADEPSVGLPHLPLLPGNAREEPPSDIADTTQPAEQAGPGAKQRPPATVHESTPHRPGEVAPPSAVAENKPQPGSASTTSPPKREQQTPTHASPRESPEQIAAAPVPISEKSNLEPEPTAPLCGTNCRLLGTAVAVGMVTAAGGGELIKDGLLLGAAESGVGMTMSGAGAAAGGVVAGTVVVDGVAEHATPRNAPAAPSPPETTNKPAATPDSAASGQRSEPLSSNRGNGGRGGGPEHARIQAKILDEVGGSDEVEIKLTNGEKRIVDVEAADGSLHQVGDMRSRGGQLRPSARERAAIEDLRKARPDADIYFHDKHGQHPPLKNPDLDPSWRRAPSKLRKDPG